MACIVRHLGALDEVAPEGEAVVMGHATTTDGSLLSALSSSRQLMERATLRYSSPSPLSCQFTRT